MENHSTRHVVIATLAIEAQKRFLRDQKTIKFSSPRAAVEEIAVAENVVASAAEIEAAGRDLEHAIVSGTPICIRVLASREGIAVYQEDFTEVRHALTAAKFLAAADSAREVPTATDLSRYVSPKMIVRSFVYLNHHRKTDGSPSVNASASQTLPAFASRFDDSDIYTALVRSRLVAFYPAGDERLQAVRVVERRSSFASWFGIETYNTRLDQWIEHKSKATEMEARVIAENWYQLEGNV